MRYKVETGSGNDFGPCAFATSSKSKVAVTQRDMAQAAVIFCAIARLAAPIRFSFFSERKKIPALGAIAKTLAPGRPRILCSVVFLANFSADPIAERC